MSWRFTCALTMSSSPLTINSDTVKNPENGPTLWDVVTQLLGEKPGPSFNVGSGTIKGKICVDTPFGEVCWDADGVVAEQHEKELKEIYLGSVLNDLFSRPRLSGACFELCSWGVCVKSAPENASVKCHRSEGELKKSLRASATTGVLTGSKGLHKSLAPRIEPLAQGPPGKICHRLFLIQGGLFQALVKRSGQIDREPDAGFPIGSSWSRGRGRRWGRRLGGWRCRGIPPHESGGIGGQQGLTGGHGSGVQ